MKQIRVWMAAAAVCGLLLATTPLFAVEGKPVNINTASVAELTSLKGVGDAKAKAIIDHREKNGPFKTVDDLKNVTGIGDKMLGNLRPQVTVGDMAAGAAPAPATKQ